MSLEFHLYRTGVMDGFPVSQDITEKRYELWNDIKIWTPHTPGFSCIYVLRYVEDDEPVRYHIAEYNTFEKKFTSPYNYHEYTIPSYNHREVHWKVI